MPKQKIKRCPVSVCNNTSENTTKIFVNIPVKGERHKRWFDVLGAIGPKRWICEDHFNLQEDAVSFDTYRRYGHKLYLKKDIVPHLYLTSPPEHPLPNQLSEEDRLKKLETIKALESTKTSPCTACTKSSDKNETKPDIKLDACGSHSTEYTPPSLYLTSVKECFKQEIIPEEDSPLTKFFTHLQELCFICNKPLVEASFPVLDYLPKVQPPIRLYDALKLLSNFKNFTIPTENLLDLRACYPCYFKTDVALSFQIICNNSADVIQSFMDGEQLHQFSVDAIDVQPEINESPVDTETEVLKLLKCEVKDTHGDDLKAKYKSKSVESSTSGNDNDDETCDEDNNTHCDGKDMSTSWEEPDLCKTSGKSFSSKSSLQSLGFKHTKKKRFVCSQCPKKFVKKRHLERHIDIHLHNSSANTHLRKGS